MHDWHTDMVDMLEHSLTSKIRNSNVSGLFSAKAHRAAGLSSVCIVLDRANSLLQPGVCAKPIPQRSISPFYSRVPFSNYTHLFAYCRYCRIILTRFSGVICIGGHVVYISTKESL